MTEAQREAALRRWAAATARERRANMAAAQSESARRRREAVERRAKQDHRRALDVVEAAAYDDLVLARALAGADSLSGIATELRRIYAARELGIDLDRPDLTTTERNTDVHRQDEEGRRGWNRDAQEARGHRPAEGNA